MRDYVRYRVANWEQAGRRITGADLERFLGEREHLIESQPSIFLRQLWALYSEYRLDLNSLKQALAAEANACRIAGNLYLALDFIGLAKRFDAKDTPMSIAQELTIREASVLGALGDLSAGVRSIEDLNSKLRSTELSKDRLYHQIVLANQLDRLGHWDALLEHVKALDLRTYKSAPTSLEATWLSLFEGIARAATDPGSFRASDLVELPKIVDDHGDARSSVGARTALSRACILARDYETATDLLDEALTLRPEFEDPLNTACHAGLLAASLFGCFRDTGQSRHLDLAISTCVGAIHALIELKAGHFLPSAWRMLGVLLAERDQQVDANTAVSMAAHYETSYRRWATKRSADTNPDQAYFLVRYLPPPNCVAVDDHDLFRRGLELLDSLSTTL